MANPDSKPVHGRGAAANIQNRFERLGYAPDPDDDGTLGEDAPKLTTQFYRDSSKSAIAYNNSPDVGFDASVNPYRGCEHGCAYCYARPTHEYLGFSAGLDFESRIMVKEDAPALLRRELTSKKWKPQTLALSGVTDCYQPIERKLKITRLLLEVLAEFRNPCVIITKNRLVTRDIDVLRDLAKFDCVRVFVSVTTLDLSLNRILEPRTSSPAQRLDAIRQLADAGIPVGTLVAPIIPGLTDHEIASILEAVGEAGGKFASYVTLRLPLAVAPLFEQWLDQHFPDRKNKIIHRIQNLRGGKMNDSRFGERMRGSGPFADQIRMMFDIACRKAGLNEWEWDRELSTEHFRRPTFAGDQIDLF